MPEVLTAQITILESQNIGNSALCDAFTLGKIDEFSGNQNIQFKYSNIKNNNKIYNLQFWDIVQDIQQVIISPKLQIAHCIWMVVDASIFDENNQYLEKIKNTKEAANNTPIVLVYIPKVSETELTEEQNNTLNNIVKINKLNSIIKVELDYKTFKPNQDDINNLKNKTIEILDEYHPDSIAEKKLIAKKNNIDQIRASLLEHKYILNTGGTTYQNKTEKINLPIAHGAHKVLTMIDDFNKKHKDIKSKNYEKDADALFKKISRVIQNRNKTNRTCLFGLIKLNNRDKSTIDLYTNIINRINNKVEENTEQTSTNLHRVGLK